MATFSYNLTVNGGTEVFQFATGAQNSDGTYTVTSTTGTFDGSTITSTTPGNSVSDQTGYIDGVNGSGVTFATANETDTLFYNAASGTLQVQEIVNGTSTTYNAVVNNYSTTACFLRGTMILTESGERAIESVQIGDMLVTGSGAVRPVKWVGRRAYNGRFAASTKALQPVRISAGALGGNQPHRDLLVSPKHAMFIGGNLVAAEDLINGVSIVQEAGWTEIEYIHVEFASHDIVVVEGCLSESFTDDDSRGIFHNAAEYHALYPNEVAVPAVYCAPRVTEGAVLEAVRASLNVAPHRLAA